MRRVAFGFLSVVLVSGAPAVGQDAPVAAKHLRESGIVRVQETPPKSEPAAPIPGIVTPDGRVLTFLGVMEGNAPRVVTSAGRTCEITGVANYLSTGQVILLTVDWKGDVPPALTLAERGPERGQKVSVTALHVDPTKESCTFTAQNSAQRPKFGLELDSAGAPDGLWGGGAVFDDAGNVIGLVNAFAMHIGVPVDPAALTAGPLTSKVLFGVPVEFLAAAAKPRDAILTLEQWRTKKAEIDKAAKLCGDSQSAFLRNEFVESVRCARQSVALNDRSSAGWATLAHVLVKIRSFEEGLKAASRAVELDPCDLQHLYREAHALSALGRTDEALAKTERLVKLAPDEKQCVRLHGILLCQAKKSVEAIPFLERAVKLDPSDAPTREALALARAELKTK